jgi:hypothetical protein
MDNHNQCCCLIATSLLKANGTVIPVMKRYKGEGKAVEEDELNNGEEDEGVVDYFLCALEDAENG